MDYLSGKIVEISVYSFLLLVHQLAHMLYIALLIAEQEDELGGVQVIVG